MRKVTLLSRKLFLSYKQLPAKKQYLEFLTALLSIPVLLTVIILNLNSLSNLKKPATVTPTPQPEKVYINVPVTQSEPGSKSVGSTGTQQPCQKNLGPISIDSPSEGDTVTDNPANIIINYDDATYCAAVWSYRINGGTWSDFDNKSIALYDLPNGAIKLELRAKSVVVNQEKTLTRNFVYKSATQSTQTSSSSAH